MRFMYWPNEQSETSTQLAQIGGRKAFQNLLKQDKISELSIFSYKVVRKNSCDQSDFEARALESIKSFNPDILFVQHIAGSKFSGQFWKKVRNLDSAMSIVYFDEDPYDSTVKKIDSDMKRILQNADLTLISGQGTLREYYAKYGNGSIKYVPHCFDNVRFGNNSEPTAKSTSLVMIGNRGMRRRLRFLYVPGGRRRATFATQLSKIYGRDLALYGTGWDGLAASRGTLPFDQQEHAIRSARISVNWDHFDHIPYYFSDRLPISLAAGVPHVTTFHPGFDEIFRGCPGLYPCRTVEEALDCVHWLLI